MRASATSGGLLALLGACTGPQHVLDASGPAAAAISDLWWLMLGLAAAVSVTVTIVLLYAVRRSTERRSGADHAEVDGRRLVWAGGVVLPALILFGVLVYSVRTGTAVYPPPGGGADALTVEVIGHQFWWEVRYPEHGVTTANEIHIPVGRPVRVLLRAPDVLHSFWIPRLQGKIDMIPGRINTVWLRADEAGAFRGQCAEYCGMAHALMAFWVVALPEDDFAEWLDRRRTPVSDAAGEQVRRGREVFFSAGCGHCHATRGAPLPPALGPVGPDLTDLASRRTIGAGSLPNTRGALAGWIADPQRIKPGIRMPGTRLPGEDMQALLDYLQSLR